MTRRTERGPALLDTLAGARHSAATRTRDRPSAVRPQSEVPLGDPDRDQRRRRDDPVPRSRSAAAVRLEAVDEARTAMSSAVAGDRPRGPRRRVLLDARAVRLGQDDDAADDRRLRAADRGPDPAPRRRTSPTIPPFDRDVNTVFQDYALFPHMTVGDNVALRPGGPQGRQGRAGRARRPRRSGWSASRATRSASRASCRAASASASRSPGRSSTGRACCSSTSRSARSTSSSARRCRSSSRRSSSRSASRSST